MTYKRSNEEDFLQAADRCLDALADCLSYIRFQLAKERYFLGRHEINHSGGVFYDYDERMARFRIDSVIDDKKALVEWEKSTPQSREAARKRIAALSVWATYWCAGEARDMRQRDADLSHVHCNDMYYTSPSIDYPVPEPLPGVNAYGDDQ